jgi:hypothetical protein
MGRRRRCQTRRRPWRMRRNLPSWVGHTVIFLFKNMYSERNARSFLDDEASGGRHEADPFRSYSNQRPDAGNLKETITSLSQTKLLTWGYNFTFADQPTNMGYNFAFADHPIDIGTFPRGRPRVSVLFSSATTAGTGEALRHTSFTSFQYFSG